MVAQESVTDTVGFLLSKLGQAATARFATALAPLGLRPRHCGVLELLAAAPAAQLDLSRRLGVTPSVIVDMLDELESLGAVHRTRDPEDRRRHLVELTPQGRDLTRQSLRLAQTTETEMLTPLNATQAKALREALVTLFKTQTAAWSPAP